MIVVVRSFFVDQWSRPRGQSRFSNLCKAGIRTLAIRCRPIRFLVLRQRKNLILGIVVISVELDEAVLIELDSLRRPSDRSPWEYSSELMASFFKHGL